MADTRLRFRIGVFVLVVLCALAVLLYLFGLYPNVFRRVQGDAYYIDFADAPNVTPNTPIRRSGVKIGQVERVVLDDETGRVLVTARVEPTFHIRQSEEPTLTTGMLSGDTTIDIVPKELRPGEEPDRTLVLPGSRLVGRVPASVTRFLDRATAAVPPAQEALARISQTLDRIEKTIPLFERTLEEYRLLARDTRRDLVPGAKQTNEEIQKLVKEVNGSLVPDLKSTNAAIRKLARDVNGLVPEVEKTIRGVNETVPDVQRLARQAADAMPELRKLIKDTNGLVPEAQRLLTDVRAGIPEVRKLVRDVNDVVPEVKKVVNGVNETIPLAQDTLKEGSVAVKNWGVAGERASVLIQTNEKAISDVLKNIDRSVGYIGETFSLENRNNLTTLLRNISEGSKRFPGISDEAELATRQGRAAFKKMEEAFDQLNRMVKPGTTSPAGDIVKNLDEAIKKLNSTMGDIQDVVRVAARCDGSLRRFLTDPSLYNHADDAALMISRVVPRLDRVLKDMEVFADKLARRPEAIGLGGVVRPSSGIKEPPRSVNYRGQ